MGWFRGSFIVLFSCAAASSGCADRVNIADGFAGATHSSHGSDGTDEGGASAQGGNSDGTPVGGATNGTPTSGGASTDGTPTSGGASTDGTPVGGATNGTPTSGGASSDGTPTSGGVSSDGTPVGGATNGTPTSGGASSDGTPAGGRDASGVPSSCFSPTQNIDFAHDPSAVGCACDSENDGGACVQDPSGVAVALSCTDNHWVAVEDAVCNPRPPHCFSPDQNTDHADDSDWVGCSCDSSKEASACAPDATGQWVAFECSEGRWETVEDGACYPMAIDTDQITLERSECFGSCPAYSITISADGTVSYQGDSFVRVHGAASHSIGTIGVQALAQRLDAAGYWSLTVPTQAECPEGWATDLPTVTTSWTRDGTTHTLQDYHGNPCAPEILPSLEDMIDRYANTAEWVSCSDGTCLAP
jgi:hypothetical protein